MSRGAERSRAYPLRDASRGHLDVGPGLESASDAARAASLGLAAAALVETVSGDASSGVAWLVGLVLAAAIIAVVALGDRSLIRAA